MDDINALRTQAINAAIKTTSDVAEAYNENRHHNEKGTTL